MNKKNALSLRNISGHPLQVFMGENNILFPLCADVFSEEDWMRIYYELSPMKTS